MTEKILFFFSAVGIFNAALLAVYLAIFKPKRHKSDYFLAGLLALLVVRVGVSCFHFFGTVAPEAIQLGLIANLLLGPLTLYTMESLGRPEKGIGHSGAWHIAIWLLALGLAWLLFDFSTWNWEIRYSIHFTLTLYLLAAAILWRKELGRLLASKPLPIRLRQALIILLSVVTICIGFAFSLFSTYILGPLTFSITFYCVIGYLLMYRQRKKQASAQTLDPLEFTQLNQRLTLLMEKEKLYRDPDLSLQQLANQLSVSRHLLSHLLNASFNKSFHQYVNDYRIQDACHILKENKHYSVEAIGNEVGFHSRSSFFSSFKKMMGTTPSKYREIL